MGLVEESVQQRCTLCGLLAMKRVLTMEVTKQSQAFTLNFLIRFPATQCSVQQLNSQCIQSQLVPQEPAQFIGRQVNAFPFELRSDSPEPGTKCTDPFSRRSPQLNIKLSTKITFAVESRFAHRLFQCINQLSKPFPRVGFLNNYVIASIGVFSCHFF